MWRFRFGKPSSNVLGGYCFTVFLLVENWVVLLGVSLLRGIAPGLTLASLRRLGVGTVMDVLFKLRIASCVNRWAAEAKKSVE